MPRDRAFNHDVPGQGPNDGQAHLFNATTGALVHTFDEPTPTSSSQFGQAVAVSGNHVVVRAPFDDSTAVNGGQAHLFNATTGALVHTLDDPTPTVVDNFGFSVAVDGDKILIGAPGHGLVGFVFGQAHLFDATTGLLSRTFDNPTPVNGDDFGCSVAIDANNVLIGACRADTAADTDVGQAYLFDAVTGLLLHTFDDPTPTSIDAFGSSVALHGDRIVIGAPLDDSSGADQGQAYLFDATTGLLTQTFNEPTSTVSDGFGFSVAIDGISVLIGAHFDDTIGTNIGQAYVFDANTGGLPLATLDDPTVTTRDRFGVSVALDGIRVVIGAHFDDTQGTNIGQANSFVCSPAGVFGQTIVAPDPNTLT